MRRLKQLKRWLLLTTAVPVILLRKRKPVMTGGIMAILLPYTKRWGAR